MEWKKFVENVKVGRIPNYSIFAGEEREMMRNVVKVVQQQTNADILKYEDYDLATLQKLMLQKGMFSNKFIIVVDNEKFISELVKVIKPTIHHLIVYTDKCEKVPAGVELVEFRKLTTPELVEYAQQHLDINKSVADILVAVSESNLSTLKNNVQKLRNYRTGKVTEEMIEEVCHIPDTFKVFDMIDAICRKEREKALYIYHRLGENNVKLLSLLYSQYRKILMVKVLDEGGLETDQIMDKTKLAKFLVENCKKMARNYTTKALIQIVDKLFDLDIKIKTGRCNDSIVYSLILYIL